MRRTAAHLLTFDSVHGRWSRGGAGDGDALAIDGSAHRLQRRRRAGRGALGRARRRDRARVLGQVPHAGDARGRTSTRGVRKVIVAAPVKEEALNVVVGVNDHLYDPDEHHLLTAASCTTNCLAPVVKVIHEGIGIRHGVDHDAARHDQHPDDRRRAAQGPAPRARRQPLADPDHHRLGHARSG